MQFIEISSPRTCFFKKWSLVEIAEGSEVLSLSIGEVRVLKGESLTKSVADMMRNRRKIQFSF